MRAQARKVQAWQQNVSGKETEGTNIAGQNTAGQNAVGKKTQQKKADRSKKSTTLVLVVLSIAVILNLPYFVYSILLVHGVPFNLSRLILVIIAQECYRANAGVNIFIYAVFTSDFRRAYMKMFCCKRHDVDANKLSAGDETNVTDDA
jgi:hypothetical protein